MHIYVSLGGGGGGVHVPLYHFPNGIKFLFIYLFKIKILVYND